MTYKEFKKKYNNKYTDFDGAYGYQCWDLAQRYFTEVLGLPSSILSGCGLVSNMLKEPKRSVLLKYFNEVSTPKQGDVAIWEYGHIAIFDSNVKKYFSQNPNPCRVIQITRGGVHYFRKKGTDKKEKVDQILHVGSKVQFDGIFKVDILKAPLGSNLFGCTQLTGCSVKNYKNGKAKSYDWIKANDFIECDKKGNKTKDQMLVGGKSYVRNSKTYEVKQIIGDSAMIHVSGYDSLIKAKYLKEV